MSQINVQKTNEDFAVPWLVSLDIQQICQLRYAKDIIDSFLLHGPQAVLDVLVYFNLKVKMLLHMEECNDFLSDEVVDLFKEDFFKYGSNVIAGEN